MSTPLLPGLRAIFCLSQHSASGFVLGSTESPLRAQPHTFCGHSLQERMSAQPTGLISKSPCIRARLSAVPHRSAMDPGAVALPLVVLVADGLSFGQHALVQDADNEDAAGIPAGGKTRHACRAPCAADQGECHHRIGLTPGCQPACGNRFQARQYKGRSELRPKCEGCNRRCLASRPGRGARNETQPWASATSRAA